jgi:type VI secretion system protein ImpM
MQSLGLGLPAWYGKLPGTGDFAYRRMDRYFQDIWDDWLQRGLMGLRDQYADWITPYLNAPLWFFALGSGLVGSKPWVGVIMPSVDSVGRYFPLTMLGAPQSLLAPFGNEASFEVAHWWGLCARHARVALDADMDAASFDAMLHAGFGTHLHQPPRFLQAPLMSMFPQPGCSTWISGVKEQGVETFSIVGLPHDSTFASLFGCDQEVTQRQDL